MTVGDESPRADACWFDTTNYYNLHGWANAIGAGQARGQQQGRQATAYDKSVWAGLVSRDSRIVRCIQRYPGTLMTANTFDMRFMDEMFGWSWPA